MILLALGVLIFSALHLVPALPGLKAGIVERVGKRGYAPLFGLVSVVALALIAVGWRISGFVPIYEPPEWGRHANFAFMLVAFICLGVFLFRGRLRQWLRLPMGIAVLFWGTGHLLANGDLRSLILFGGFLAYALIHIGIGVSNGARPSPEIRSGHDVVSILMGIALYGAMTQLHPVLIGVPILNLQH